MLSAIIVAAGSSQRMGFDKLFALLGDKPVIAHTLDAFERAECVDEIILVGRDDRLAELRDLDARAGLRKVRHFPGRANGYAPSTTTRLTSRRKKR